MSNPHYNRLASDIAEMSEQNEAYVAISNDQPENLSSSVSSTRVSPDISASNQPSGHSGSQSTAVGNGNNRESTERIDGYDEVFTHSASTDYECPVCMLVLRNPVQTPCGHRFCGACIRRHIATNASTCPIDNQQIDENEIYPDNFAKREINQLPVKCRTVKNKKECTWTGPLMNVEDHLKICDFVEVPCPKGCNQNIERKAVDHHLKKECPKRTITCAHCKTEVQHKNYKDHLGKCQKVTVQCPNCNKKMLREKLTTGHERECPKAQAVCDFRSYGCKWTGLRAQLPSHLTNEASMANHLSMLVGSLPNQGSSNGQKGKNGGTKSEASGNASGNGAGSGNSLEELKRQINRNTESIVTFGEKIEVLERKNRDFNNRIDRQRRENEENISALKSKFVELEARMCNGVYLWRITGYARHLENARDNAVTALHSPPFYTSFYGYKLCLRINPNGVDTGYGSHVSLFVHMMQSEWDDTLEWPFSGRISLSILDQSDDGEYKRHISETLVTRPNLLAFQRPTTPRNHKGYGYVEFAHIETLQDRQYLKNDCLLVRVQVFQ